MRKLTKYQKWWLLSSRRRKQRYDGLFLAMNADTGMLVMIEGSEYLAMMGGDGDG